jgi:hypothetical protein
MTEAEALRRVREARKQRERADRAQRDARLALGQRVREAQAAGVPVTRIAEEANLSRQGVYDLLGQARPS